MLAIISYPCVHIAQESNVAIYGFARTNHSCDEFRTHIRKTLKGDAAVVENFLRCCYYFAGSYTEVDSFRALADQLKKDADSEGREEGEGKGQEATSLNVNRLFYFAVPPNVFVPSAKCIRETLVSTSGWTRLIVEKPFGHDLRSAQVMSQQLGDLFAEDHIYRIDHYLGKEMVQNLIMFRFGNVFMEPLLNHNYVNSVQITFKEDFGTEGRGGYFDNYGK
jgi:glucose-6-phosphate 1-dehydrogenase